MTMIEIRATALNLPGPERAALAHDLIASLDAEDVDPRADSLWAAEIEPRARDRCQELHLGTSFRSASGLGDRCQELHLDRRQGEPESAAAGS